MKFRAQYILWLLLVLGVFSLAIERSNFSSATPFFTENEPEESTTEIDESLEEQYISDLSSGGGNSGLITTGTLALSKHHLRDPLISSVDLTLSEECGLFILYCRLKIDC